MYASEVCLSYSSVEEHPADRARRQGVLCTIGVCRPHCSLIWRGRKVSSLTWWFDPIPFKNTALEPWLSLKSKKQTWTLSGYCSKYNKMSPQLLNWCVWISSSSNFRPVRAVSVFIQVPCVLCLSVQPSEMAGRPLNRLDFSVWGCGGAKRYVLLAFGFPCWHMKGQVGP